MERGVRNRANVYMREKKMIERTEYERSVG